MASGRWGRFHLAPEEEAEERSRMAAVAEAAPVRYPLAAFLATAFKALAVAALVGGVAAAVILDVQLSHSSVSQGAGPLAAAIGIGFAAAVASGLFAFLGCMLDIQLGVFANSWARLTLEVERAEPAAGGPPVAGRSPGLTMVRLADPGKDGAGG